jgi:7,8-dihydropterin-6-yl-methyl-4-(beta-D-ribofuranosyl)aminobenzene 5'-phosphate synthase
MYIQNLIENTSSPDLSVPLLSEHGLSFYIEAGGHTILLDTGASPAFMVNAESLNLDLTKVETVILSHGHYDHGGGLPSFLSRYPQALLCLRSEAFGQYYSLENDHYHRIGIDLTLRDYPQLLEISGASTALNDALFLFSDVSGQRCLSDACSSLLVKKDTGYEHDAFRHEQNLVVTENTQHVLFSSCSHCGIINILDEYDKYFDQDPDFVIGGFHLMDPGSGRCIDHSVLEEIARELSKRNTIYYTGHCTGLEAYEVLQRLMGDQIRYCHTGECIPARENVSVSET